MVVQRERKLVATAPPAASRLQRISSELARRAQLRAGASAAR